MKIYPLLFSYINILLLVACFSTNDVTPVQVTSTIIPTETSYPTPIPTVTPTYIVTSTPLPIPTLSEEARQELVLELLKTNNGCKLPCFWRVIPGSTSLIQGKQILANLGLTLSDPEVYRERKISSLSVVDLYRKKVSIFSGAEINQDDLITMVELRATGMDYAGSHYSELQSSMSEYSPQSILNSYGEPSRVWVVTSARYRYGDRAGFDLWVFYDKQGFLIIYSELMEFATTYHYCPRFGGDSHIDDIRVILSYPNNPEPLEIQYDGYDVLKDYPDYIYPIEKLGYTNSEFYEIIAREKQEGCLIIREETLRK